MVLVLAHLHHRVHLEGVGVLVAQERLEVLDFDTALPVPVLNDRIKLHGAVGLLRQLVEHLLQLLVPAQVLLRQAQQLVRLLLRYEAALHPQALISYLRATAVHVSLLLRVFLLEVLHAPLQALFFRYRAHVPLCRLVPVLEAAPAGIRAAEDLTSGLVGKPALLFFYPSGAAHVAVVGEATEHGLVAAK